MQSSSLQQLNDRISSRDPTGVFTAVYVWLAGFLLQRTGLFSPSRRSFPPRGVPKSCLFFFLSSNQYLTVKRVQQEPVFLQMMRGWFGTAGTQRCPESKTRTEPLGFPRASFCRVATVGLYRHTVTVFSCFTLTPLPVNWIQNYNYMKGLD